MKRGSIIFLFLVLLSSLLVSVSAISIADPISGQIISGKLVQQNLNINIVLDGPPSLFIVVPENGTNFGENETVQLNFTYFGADNFWYNVNGTANITLNGNITLSLGNGTYILYLFANNSLGVTEKSVSFTVAAEIEDDGELPGGPGCTVDWACNDWSACVNGLQTRSCVDLNDCNSERDKPSEERDCVQGLCVDGTSYDQCSTEQPVFCKDGGVLENKCSLCSCEAGDECLLSGACGITCEDDDECPTDYECKQGVCWLEEKECLVDSDCPVDKYCDQGVCSSISPAVPQPLFNLGEYGFQILILVIILVILFIINSLVTKKRRKSLKRTFNFVMPKK